ncbi:AraC family transcriptional regulator [Piscinibacter sp. HJYY11]|uniref:helix-turn-helix domain-containing protein n=1 Tax=Piscinibacter sp. HJYY11 TaxID=2801333 RepID=UPI00191EFC41|nr:AraC family transcriptional regulator [Piscinibacter sp. HJYY11]MBL0729867.1 helix-turn-helix transcriptional regulator [Piscinibacter sp. HJYY11]
MPQPPLIPYTELPLDGLDAERVEALWVFVASGPDLQRVLPDGRTDIVVRFHLEADHDTISRPRLVIAGPTLDVRGVPAQAGTGLLGLRFKLGWAGACLGISPKLLRDRELLHDEADALLPLHADRLKRCRSLIELKQMLVSTARELLQQARTTPGQVLAAEAVRLLRSAPQRPDLKLLCRQLGVSERALRREVLEAVGVPLRSLASIVRFHRAMMLMREPGARPSEVAAEAGYSDQAHMNREFRRYGGFTPAVPMEASLIGRSTPPGGAGRNVQDRWDPRH